MSCATKWTDVANVVLAAAAVVALIFSLLTYRYYLQEQELANRAWLVPVSATFVDNIAEMSRIEIDLQNDGKTPAVSVRQTDVLTVAREFQRSLNGAPYIDSVIVGWPRDPVCPSYMPKPRSARFYPANAEPVAPLYPGQHTEYVRHIPAAAYDEMTRDNKHLIVVRGCFIYTDGYGERRSPYCFYSVPKEAGQPGFERKLRSCPRGAEDPT